MVINNDQNNSKTLVLRQSGYLLFEPTAAQLRNNQNNSLIRNNSNVIEGFRIQRQCVSYLTVFTAVAPNYQGQSRKRRNDIESIKFASIRYRIDKICVETISKRHRFDHQFILMCRQPLICHQHLRALSLLSLRCPAVLAFFHGRSILSVASALNKQSREVKKTHKNTRNKKPKTRSHDVLLTSPHDAREGRWTSFWRLCDHSVQVQVVGQSLDDLHPHKEPVEIIGVRVERHPYLVNCRRCPLP